MQKVVLKLDIHDDTNCKQKAMKMISSIAGLESISVDMKDKKLTVTGDMDPVSVVKKLRKNYRTEIISVGPVKEPEKPKEEPKKPEPVVHVTDLVHPMRAYYNSSNNSYYIDPYYSSYGGYYRSVEEDPNACVIC